MTWKALYNTQTGELIACGTTIADPPPAGTATRTLGAEPDFQNYQWDQVTRGMVPRTPQRIINRVLLIERLTDQEQRDFLGFVQDSTKTEAQRKRVQAFYGLLLLLDTINLDAGNIVSGVQYLETVGVLSVGRAAQILS